jgi:glycosyltransferase involved in cell wall biosynthesis
MQMKKPHILLTHPGTQYAHRLAVQLYKKGLLSYFVTGIAISSKSYYYHLFRCLPGRMQRKISNRIIQELPQQKIRLYPWLEWKYVRKSKQAAYTDAIWFERNAIFQQRLSPQLLKEADVVIGFDTASNILIQRTHQFGKKFVLDVSIAHSLSKEAIFKQLALDYPDWSVRIEHKTEAHLAIEEEEQRTADYIVVASSFTKQTLLAHGVPEEKITVIPYGVNLEQFTSKKNYLTDGPLRLLFTGTIDARKGIPVLLDVMKQLQELPVTLTLVGPVIPQVIQLIESANLPNVTIKGKVPHSELPAIMQAHDVFVFPSYFEGFGLVLLEAMACGLPIITTPATAGPDIIEEGKEGFIIPIGNAAACKQAILNLLEDRNKLAEMGKAAVKKAHTFTWDRYGNAWATFIQKIVSP